MACMKHWSRELTTELIQTYTSNPCLWKRSCKEYKDAHLKYKAYTRLIEICKEVDPAANKEFAFRKIQSLRASFRKEARKVSDSKKRAASEKDVHIPTLWYYNLLLPTTEQDEPSASIKNRDSDEIESETNEVRKEEESDSEQHTRGRTEEFELQGGHAMKPENNLVTQSYGGASNRTTRQKGENGVFKTNLDCMGLWKTRLEKNDDIDEYDAVAISFAKKLRRMDPTQAIYAESLISQVMTHGLLKRLTHTTQLSDYD